MTQLFEELKRSGVEFKAGFEVSEITDRESHGVTVRFQNGTSLDARNGIIACGSWAGKVMNPMSGKLSLQDGKGYSMDYQNLPVRPTIPSLLIEPRVAITPMGNDLRISGTLEISGMDDKINPNKVNSILEAGSRRIRGRAV